MTLIGMYEFDLTRFPSLPNRADPFWVILEFQLAWVLDFCIWPKQWKIQKFFEIGPHLPTAPKVFLNHTPKIY